MKIKLSQRGHIHLGLFVVMILSVIAVMGAVVFAHHSRQNVKTALLQSTQGTAAIVKPGKLEGRLVMYNHGGIFDRVAVGISTHKGVLESPVPNTQAYCIVGGQKITLATQPGQYLYTKLPRGDGARSLVCSASSFFVYYLKRGQDVHDANQYARAAPSVSEGFCTYVVRLLDGKTQDQYAFNTKVSIQKMLSSGGCPSIRHANGASAPQPAVLTARYNPPTIIRGQQYQQIFELRLKSGEPMSPVECGGQIAISHPNINTPARNYSIRYYDQTVVRDGQSTRICRFVQNVRASTSASYDPKQDMLDLCFSGNAYVEKACTTLKIDRR